MQLPLTIVSFLDKHVPDDDDILEGGDDFLIMEKVFGLYDPDVEQKNSYENGGGWPDLKDSSSLPVSSTDVTIGYSSTGAKVTFTEKIR
jgi:hypothetical protein